MTTENTPKKTVRTRKAKKEPALQSHEKPILGVVGNTLWILAKDSPSELEQTVTISEIEHPLPIEWVSDRNAFLTQLLTGYNLLENGDFTEGDKKSLKGWTIDTGQSATAGVDLADEWQLAEGHTAYLLAAEDAPRPSFSSEQKIPVITDTEYRFSGFFATHRADGLISLINYDENHNKISEKLLNIPNDPEWVGGKYLKNYAYFESIFTPINGTQYIKLEVKLGRQIDLSEPNAFLFCTQLFFGVNDEKQSQHKNAYSDGACQLIQQALRNNEVNFGKTNLPRLNGVEQINVDYCNNRYEIDLTHELNVIPKRNIIGNIDKCNADEISGWIIDKNSPNEALKVEVLVDGQFIYQIVADVFRKDLLESGVSNGCSGFNISIPSKFIDGKNHILNICEISTGVMLSKECEISQIQKPSYKSEYVKHDFDNLNMPGCYEFLNWGQSSGNEFRDLSISDNIKVVSFDVWDTLLRRNCHPDEIKLSSARYLLVNYYFLLKPVYRNVTTLFKARKSAEDNSSCTDDFEYKFVDAMPNWILAVFENGLKYKEIDDIVQLLHLHEFNAELKVTEKDEQCCELAEKLKSKSVIFASDFYMPVDFIHKLLSNNKVPFVFVKGYSSCDLIKNKRSGDMYPHILEDFSIRADQLLHIGDNEHADVMIPKKLGIGHFYYQNKDEASRRDWYGMAFYQKMEGNITLHNKRVISLVTRKANELIDNNDITKLKKLGICLAPLAIGYVLHIIEYAKKHNIETIFFLTREGVFLKQLYDLVIKLNPYHLTDYPKSELLEVSRLATFGASLKEVNSPELMRMWSLYSTQSPEAFCKSINIPEQQVKSIFENNGLSFSSPVQYPWENSKFKKILASKEFQKIVTEFVKPQKANLIAYLNEKGFNKNKSSLVVDLGWRGTIQDNLCHVSKIHIHGCYFGLFQFLNKQPINSSKSSWLFDENIDLNSFLPGIEVAPLEMLFNSPDGSVTHYENTSSGIIAIRNLDKNEDAVFEKYTQWIQKGIIEATSCVVDYVTVHGLMAEDLKPSATYLVKKIISEPSPLMAQAFFDLSHNETFGTGTHEDMNVIDRFIENMNQYENNELHFSVQKALQSVRWQAALTRLEKIRIAFSKLPTRKVIHLPSNFYNEMETAVTEKKFKIGIFLPAPIAGSGGHRTIFNMACKFSKMGHDVHCFLESEGEGLNIAYDYIGDERIFISIGWVNYLHFDLAIATIAHSAKFVASLDADHKAYLVQDFEAWFNPVGDAFTVAENSYTYDLFHFTIGNWLSHVLTSQYGARCVPAGLGIDTQVYYPLKDVRREKAICFLYQPEKPRRNPSLGISALRIVKEKHPDIKIYVYGSNATIDLDFDVENLGLIRNLNELNSLYNKCQIGLCISMSNPSRIPFEFMAAGAVPVDVYRYNNLMDYPSGTIKMAYQSPESLAGAICQLLENKTELNRRSKACQKFAKTRTLEWETDVIVNSFLALTEGKLAGDSNVKIDYTDNPVIADCDKNESVITFCKWQKNLAT